MKRNITVLGDGGWGTAIAVLLCKNGHDVKLWGAFPEQIEEIRRERVNHVFLPGVPLPLELGLTGSIDDAANGADIVVMAVPTRFAGSVLDKFAGRFRPKTIGVTVSKGFDPENHLRMSELVDQKLKLDSVCALSGPSHANEVAKGLPTAVVSACPDIKVATLIQDVFMNQSFRVYSSSDIVGVEIGGALKNIIAVAAGVSDGLGLGDNSKAALITRGLAEITRLGVALGAEPQTFAGLSGMGDLIVTCASLHSRNRGVGERLGKGEHIDDILKEMKQVAEGISNCAVVKMLADDNCVEAPITTEMLAVINGEKAPLEAMEALMSRDAKPEAY